VESSFRTYVRPSPLEVYPRGVKFSPYWSTLVVWWRFVGQQVVYIRKDFPTCKDLRSRYKSNTSLVIEDRIFIYLAGDEWRQGILPPSLVVQSAGYRTPLKPTAQSPAKCRRRCRCLRKRRHLSVTTTKGGRQKINNAAMAGTTYRSSCMPKFCRVRVLRSYAAFPCKQQNLPLKK